MNKFVFVGGLYVIGLGTLVLGGYEAYQRVAFWINGAEGGMTSTDRDLIRVAKYNPDTAIYANVTYNCADGVFNVERKHIRMVHIVPLAAGKSVPVRFLKHDLHNVFYEHEDIPHGLWSILGGSLLFSLALWSHRKLREEQGAAPDGGALDGDAGD